jgi:hypothetical protein
VTQWTDRCEFFKYPPEIHRFIYTTNAIKSLNYQLWSDGETRLYSALPFSREVQQLEEDVDDTEMIAGSEAYQAAKAAAASPRLPTRGKPLKSLQAALFPLRELVFLFREECC